jgi:hypothetical protein
MKCLQARALKGHLLLLQAFSFGMQDPALKRMVETKSPTSFFPYQMPYQQGYPSPVGYTGL